MGVIVLYLSSQNLQQGIGAVGHDSIQTLVDEALHVLGLVDRPDMHLNIAVMSEPQEQAGDDRDAVPAFRDLQGLVLRGDRTSHQ